MHNLQTNQLDRPCRAHLQSFTATWSQIYPNLPPTNPQQIPTACGSPGCKIGSLGKPRPATALQRRPRTVEDHLAGHGGHGGRKNTADLSNWWFQPEKHEFVRLDHHPNVFGKIKFMFQTTNQLYIYLRFIHVIVYLHVIVDCFRS